MAEKSKLLNASAILACEDRPIERMEIPEWGGHIFVQGMSGAEKDAFEQAIFRATEKGKNPLTRARLVAYCAVDKDGKKLFTKEQVAQLAMKSSAVLERIFSRAQELSGIREGDLQAAEENFTDAPSEGSTSD